MSANNPEGGAGTDTSDTDLDAALGKRRSPVGVVLAFIGGLLVGGGGVATSVSLGDASDAEAGAASASASAAPEPPSASAAPSAEPPKLTVLDRARKGEDEALEELGGLAPGERDIEQTLAIAEGNRATKLSQIAEIKRKVELLPKYAREKPGKAQILDLARDREVSTDTLAMLASLPGDVGPDLLYEIWTGTRGRNETTELAEQLLHTKDLRPKASKALSIALDIRETEDCDTMAKLLQAAIEDGDRRSLVPIVRLNNKRGCGEKKRDDCWPCIRDTNLLKDAVVATRSRRAP
jgi:hypothetical protein